jgi:hypothetical protein
MNSQYILKFEYRPRDINDALLPWHNQIYSIDPEINDSINERFQIGVAIKYDTDKIQILTPFFIHVPYSNCVILRPGLSSIKLKLYNYCYFNNLASFIIDDETTIIDGITIDDQLLRNNLLINDDNIYYVKNIDNNSIITNTRIEFDNINNKEVFPFIWIRGEVDDNGENILCGTIVIKINQRTNEEEFIGIVFNITDLIVNIIPIIGILNVIKKKPLYNIFIDYDIYHNQLFIKQVYSKLLKNNKNKLMIGDIILSINNQIIDRNGMIDDSLLGVKVPIQTYLIYANIETKLSVDVIRNNSKLSLNITTELLYDILGFEHKEKTNFIINNNTITCVANIYMFDWLIENDICPKCNVYLEYKKVNPYKNKQLIFIGFIDIYKQPKHIINMIEQYIPRIYQLGDFIEFFTIIKINSAKIPNINQCRSIEKLILSDSDNNELLLDLSQKIIK